MAYQAVEEIQNRCEKESIPFWKAVQLEDCEENGITEEESWQQMTLMWTRMKESVDAYDPCERSRSGLVGKEGGLMDQYRLKEDTLCGDFVSKVIANALKMGCNNACMKRIVAAPTAGACGVMPAVLVTYFREYGVEEDCMIEAMYVAAGIGQVIANRASLAGASGGCQAGNWFRIWNDSGSNLRSQEEEVLFRWACLCDGTQESDGACVRSGSRTCRSSMCKEKCRRCSQCTGSSRYGTGRNHQSDSGRSGDRCYGGSRHQDGCESSRDKPWRCGSKPKR